MAAKLKIAGAWSGVLEVDLEQWTVAMLREEIGRRSVLSIGEGLNLICGGKVLKDRDEGGTHSYKLGELGVKNNAKVLASKAASADQGKALVAEEERDRRLSRIKAAVTSMAHRHAEGFLPFEDFNIELENQNGEKVHLGSETDQRAIMTGLMLHTNSKPLIRREKFKEALELLTMAEEAFSLCNSKAIELVDNVSILQIDMVWCYFMLQDISRLSLAGLQLSKAREGLERAYGKESSRLRLLQGGRFPEIALHMRLELLEGVVAYHSGQLEKSRLALTSAQTKYFKLQVPDEVLSQLMSMGYKERDAKRALRMNNQDVGAAVEFLVQEMDRRAQKRKEDLRRQKEIMEQKHYGVTPLKKAVDLQMLKRLTSIGYDKELAAEALRRHENDFQNALDDLTDAEANSRIQLEIETRKRRKRSLATDAFVDQLTSMGYARERVVAATQAYGTGNGAIDRILENLSENSTVPAKASLNSTAPISNQANPLRANGNSVGSSGTSGSSSENFEEDRDVEMEEELAEELFKADTFSDYDIEVTREGEAVNEYLALLDSAEKGVQVSSPR